MVPFRSSLRDHTMLLASSAIVVVALIGVLAYSPAITSDSTTRVSSAQTTSSTTIRSGNAQVTIPFDAGNNESLNFQPSAIGVVTGVNNTVVWVNDDPLQHTVTSSSVPAGALRFDSGILNQGQTFSLTLTVPGTYHYFCTIHPTWMRGTIQVVG